MNKGRLRLVNRNRIELITVREAAELLAIAEKTIHNRGAGTHVLQRKNFGRAVRLIRSEVEALRDQHLDIEQPIAA